MDLYTALIKQTSNKKTPDSHKVTLSHILQNVTKDIIREQPDLTFVKMPKSNEKTQIVFSLLLGIFTKVRSGCSWIMSFVTFWSMWERVTLCESGVFFFQVCFISAVLKVHLGHGDYNNERSHVCSRADKNIKFGKVTIKAEWLLGAIID